MVIKTKDKQYVYSGNTGQIAEISQKFEEDINNILLYENVNLTEFETTYPCIFSPSPIEEIIIGYSDEEIRHQIETNLKHMTISITNECNMRCKYCVYSGNFSHYRTHSNKVMSKKIAFKSADYFLDHISNDGEPKFFTFYGGEPLLNFSLIKEVISYIKSRTTANIYFSITTNGTLIDDEKIDFLINNKIFLMVSLDGDKQTHDKNRVFFTGNPTFEVIMKNLNSIKEISADYYKYYILFSVTLTEGCDYKIIDDFFSKLENPCKISGVLAYGSRDIKPIKNTSKNIKYIINKFVQGCWSHTYDAIDTRGPYFFALNVVGTTIKLLHTRDVSNCHLAKKQYMLRRHCIPGSTKIFVSPEGNFYPCEKLDSHDHLIIGNIYEGVNLEKVKKYLDNFIKIKNQKCKNCFLLNICNLCFQSASNGCIWDITKFELFCQYAKDDFKNGLVIYTTILEKDEDGLRFLERL